MTGISIDNQPDFTWLDVYEEKCSEQYFLPYHSLSMMQSASRDTVIRLQRGERGIERGLYVISPLNEYRLTIRETGKCNALLDDAVALIPAAAIQGVLHGINPGRLTIELSDADDNIVLSYQKHQPRELSLSDVAKAPLAAQDITSTDEAWFIGQHLEQYHHASHSPLDYYLRGVVLDPLDYCCNLALAMLEYNRTDFPRAVTYVTQALKRARALNKSPRCGQTNLIRAGAYERQGQYQQAEEDFWRAVWSGNSRASGYYGPARLAVRNGNFDADLDFRQQSPRVCSTNQEVLCLHNLLLVLNGRQGNAHVRHEKLLRDYPLSTALWWLSWLDGRSKSALAQQRGLCQGRDANALIAAGQLIN